MLNDKKNKSLSNEIIRYLLIFHYLIEFRE